MSRVGTPYLTNVPENPNDYHALCIGVWKNDDDNSYDSYYFIVDEKLICSYPDPSIYKNIKSGFAGSIVLGNYLPTEEGPCTKDSYYRCLAFGTKSDIATAINNCKYLYKTYVTG